MYVPSNNISVFPSTARTEKPGSIYTSEKNLSNILNSINDYQSYIIEPFTATDTADGNTSVSAKLVLGGYYFEISNWIVSLSSLSGDYYASIEVAQSDYNQLTGTDEIVGSISEYRGLKITDKKSQMDGDRGVYGSSTKTYYLKVFNVTSSTLTGYNISTKIKTDSIETTSGNHLPKIITAPQNSPTITPTAPTTGVSAGDIFIVYKNWN